MTSWQLPIVHVGAFFKWTWSVRALISTSVPHWINRKEKQRGTLCSHALTAEVIVRIVWEGEEEEGEHRGATRMKDVSLPVCHKSSVLLCDRLADRAGSVSAGTHRLLLYSHISFFYIYIFFFLRCSSHFLRQSEGGRKRAATGSMSRKQTRVSLVRLLVSVKVYGLCRAESPQSTIMTRRDNRESAATGWIHSAAFEWCLKRIFFFFYNAIVGIQSCRWEWQTLPVVKSIQS